MTTVELSNEFDILYNNISSNQAPGLDEYEKSVFLTKAQEAVVTSLYNSFEKTEADRELLASLVTYEVLSPVTDTPTITLITSIKKDPNLIFRLPKSLMFIVGEELIVNKEKCGKKKINVRPVQIDELPKILDNPFNGVNSRQALRTNLSLGQDEQFVELYTNEKTFDYIMSYIKIPEPIMLYDSSFSSLTINDFSPDTKPRECKLNPMLHRTILETAVADAVARYK